MDSLRAFIYLHGLIAWMDMGIASINKGWAVLVFVERWGLFEDVCDEKMLAAMWW